MKNIEMRCEFYEFKIKMKNIQFKHDEDDE